MTPAEPGASGSATSGSAANVERVAFGLRGRLLLAFVAISLFVIIAAAAGMDAFREIGQTLDQITIRSIPPALAAAGLARQSEKIVAAGPALLNAIDEQEVEPTVDDGIERIGERVAKIGAVVGIDPQCQNTRGDQQRRCRAQYKSGADENGRARQYFGGG